MSTQIQNHSQNNKILACNATRLLMVSFVWNIALIFMLNSETNHFSYIQRFYESSDILQKTAEIKQCKHISNTILKSKQESQIKQENDKQWYYDLVPTNVRDVLPITHNPRPMRGQFNVTETAHYSILQYG